MFAGSVVGRWVDSIDTCPWGAASGRHVGPSIGASRLTAQVIRVRKTLYTPEEKRRRDESVWTLVQGFLAPLQFLVFAISLVLVLNFLFSGSGERAAIASVLVKTLCLYTIMVTGAIWEHAVFGRYLFAPAFFWEDAVSMVVIGLHTAYVVALLSGALDTRALMLLALAAYATYVVNATQFVLKLRAARRVEQDPWHKASRGLRQT